MLEWSLTNDRQCDCHLRRSYAAEFRPMTCYWIVLTSRRNGTWVNKDFFPSHTHTIVFFTLLFGLCLRLIRLTSPRDDSVVSHSITLLAFQELLSRAAGSVGRDYYLNQCVKLFTTADLILDVKRRKCIMQTIDAGSFASIWNKLNFATFNLYLQVCCTFSLEMKLP
jgi:hypothetical protein